jgi:hypothetical protein
MHGLVSPSYKGFQKNGSIPNSNQNSGNLSNIETFNTNGAVKTYYNSMKEKNTSAQRQ